jgi:hypothetical protein
MNAAKTKYMFCLVLRRQNGPFVSKTRSISEDSCKEQFCSSNYVVGAPLLVSDINPAVNCKGDRGLAEKPSIYNYREWRAVFCKCTQVDCVHV